MKKIIIIVLSLSIILGFLFWKFGPSLSLFQGPKVQENVELTYWGLWEEENLIEPVILEYERQNPHIRINFVRQSSINYRTRVQTQIKEGMGPDVFRVHNSWLPMFEADLAPAPPGVFSLVDYQNTFYPVAVDSFVKGEAIYAAPMEIDGLALFYNEELLGNVGGKVPRNWREFIDAAVKMTIKDQSGIKVAGAGLGAAGNVDHWSDLLGLLLLQEPGVNLTNPASNTVAGVIRFYTGFVTDPRKKVWDVNLPKSTDMFASGRLGFYFAPSWRAHEIRVTNPNLKFQIVPVPQLPGAVKQAAWASFWGEAVSKTSQHPEEAWKFVRYLTSAETQKLFYQEASKVRLFGEAYSRLDLAVEIADDPLAGAFVTQGPNYKFWYLSSNTFDAGINDEMIKYWEDGINATLAGTDPQVALQTVDRGVKQVLEKYTRATPAATR